MTRINPLHEVAKRVEVPKADRRPAPDDWMYWLLAGAELAGDKRVFPLLPAGVASDGLLREVRSENWDCVQSWLHMRGVKLHDRDVVLSILNTVRDVRTKVAVDMALVKAQASLRLAGTTEEALAVLDEATRTIRSISAGLCVPSSDSPEFC